MLSYLRASLRRKLARRRTTNYGYQIESTDIPGVGKVDYALWQNPLFEQVPFSSPLIDFFTKHIPSGSFALDIGAHVGDTTVPMALAAGPSGLVLGFDPNPYVFEILQVNAGLNPELTHIVPHNFAITEEDGLFYYRSSDASFTNGGISAIPDSTRHGKYKLDAEIRGVRLMDFLQAHYQDWLPKLSFVKIDAEGFDLQIIKTISELLTTHQPILLTEMHRKSTEETRTEMFEVLSDLGYNLTLDAAANFDQDIPESIAPSILTADNLRHDFTFNILATPKV